MSNYKTMQRLDYNRLEDLLSKISSVSVVVIGDICLDIYWKADMTKSELSRETPHYPLPIVEEWMSPGGAGNVAANVAALKAQQVHLLGTVGKDWRGDALIKEIRNRGIRIGGILECTNWRTNAYCKPLRAGISDVIYEDPRIDFDNFDPIPEEDEERLLTFIDSVAGSADVICVSDQKFYGCITPRVRERLIQLSKNGCKVVVDSRDRIALYNDVILKPNEVEGFRAVHAEGDPRNADFDDFINAANKLALNNESKVCMTLGEKGSVCVDGNNVHHMPAYKIMPPIDFCGAGDTFLSAFSCAVAAGAALCEAAALANIAAAVVIQKIGITGTASKEEIVETYRNL